MDEQTIELAKYRIEKASEELQAAKYLLEKSIYKSSLSALTILFFILQEHY